MQRSISIVTTLALTAAALVLTAIPAPADDGGFLLWADNDAGVWRARLDGSSPEQVVGWRSLGNSVAVDTAAGHVYFSAKQDDGPWALWRADLDGANQIQLAEVGSFSARGLSLDAAGGKLYFATYDLHLQRMNLDGSAVETLFASTHRVDDLDLDLTASPARIYFIDSPDVGPTQIRSCLLDGSELITLPNVVVAEATLAVDGVNDRLYIGTQVPATAIQRMDLDGSNVVTLVTDTTSSPLQVVGDLVYYKRSSGLWRMNLDGSGQEEVLTSARGTVFDFWVDDAGNQACLGSAGITRIGLDGSGESTVVAEVGSYFHNVAAAADGSLYFVARSEDLLTAPWNDGQARLLTVDSSPFDKMWGLSLDPTADQIYFATVNGIIGRLGTDGTGLTQLLTGEATPHDIAVDPVGDAIYWTANITDPGGTDPTGVIRTAGRDGSNPADVVTGLARQIRGLAVDPTAGQLYFTDFASDQIRRVDTNGAGLTDLVAATNPHDVAFDAVGGKIYWTEGFSDSPTVLTGVIRRANLDGSGAEDVLTGLPSTIRDLTVVYDAADIFADGFESGNLTHWSVSIP